MKKEWEKVGRLKIRKKEVPFIFQKFKLVNVKEWRFLWNHDGNSRDSNILGLQNDFVSGNGDFHEVKDMWRRGAVGDELMKIKGNKKISDMFPC